MANKTNSDISGVTFKHLDYLEKPVNEEVPTIITVKTGLATSKIVLIVGSIVIVGVIASVGLGVGISSLNKENDPPSTTPSPPTISIDGQWTYWDPWSDCSKTCGTGLQSRKRRCSAPFPLNGGKNCIGDSSQQRKCAEWACPDCGRSCPSGGSLSADCQLCKCSSMTLFGSAISMSKTPLGDVDVFLQTRPYKPIATTNTWGKYFVSNLCIEGEPVFFSKSGFLSNTTVASKINSTHWKADAEMRYLERPYFVIDPQPKVRFVGQEVSLCCEAAGFPTPTTYTWLKDDNIIPSSNGQGQINIKSASLRDEGSYKCRVETEAGVAMSSEAELKVLATSPDSCGSQPEAKLETLPDGCMHISGNGRTRFINVGQCSRQPCIKLGLTPNGSCEEYWPTHCCDVKEVSLVNISCDGNFTYPMTILKSCHCREESDVSLITGRIYGVKDGIEYPFSRGEVIVDGEIVTYTSPSGFFSFVLPERKSSVAVNFMNDASKKLLDTIRVINIPAGVSSTVNIIAPLKPSPKPFSASIGFEFAVGEDQGRTPLSRLSIPGDSLVDENGQKYTGQAQAIVHTVDPRSMDDFTVMNGELSTVDEEGRNLPLETYGMSMIKVEDSNGNPLHISGDIESTIDASVFNISNDENGNPKVNSWYLDPITGKWVDSGPYTFVNSGRRKLLSQMIKGKISVSSIPTIAQKKTVEQLVVRYRYYRVSTGVWWWNCDYVTRSAYIYTNTREVDKSDACFVKVVTYSDLFYNSRLAGVKVTAVTQERNGERFRGKDEQFTGRNGVVCMKIFCNERIYLFAEKGGSLYASTNHSLPSGFSFLNMANGTQVHFNSTNPYTAKTASKIRYSPVYDVPMSKKCSDSFSDISFMFAPLVKKPTLTTATGSKDILDKEQSWYTKPPKSPLRRVCFVKVKIEADEQNIRLIGTSAMPDLTPYGSYETQAIWDETTPNQREKGACIEFRCPGPTYDGKIVTATDVDTLVQVNVMHRSCQVKSYVKNGTSIAPTRNGFTFRASSTDNYGSKYGIFIKNGDVDTVRMKCHTGQDTVSISEIMKPSVNPAVTIQCT